MIRTTTFETTLDLFGESAFHSDEFNVPVQAKLKWDGEDFDILELTRMDTGAQIIVTTDLFSELAQKVTDNWDSIYAQMEGEYIDHCYEQVRDERNMEL